jgi:hypothetical protein
MTMSKAKATQETTKSKNFEKYKAWYESGMWTKRMLRDVTAKGKITTDEYTEITGEEYSEE